MKYVSVRLSIAESKLKGLRSRLKTMERIVRVIKNSHANENHYLRNNFTLRTMERIKRLNNLESKIISLAKPFNGRTRDNYETYVKLNSAQRNRLERLVSMDRESWERFKQVFMTDRNK